MHTLVYVILPPTTQDIHAAVTQILAGSDAAPDAVYPTFPVRCYCWDGNSLSDSFDQVDADSAVMFPARIAQAHARHDEEAVSRILHERMTRAKALQQQHPDYGKADATCDTCHGTGTYQRSRDPANYWDWWEIGGRWDGWCDQGHHPRSPTDAVMDGNTALGRDLLLLPPPGAFITPNGHWYEGPMVFDISPPDDQVEGQERQERQDWEALIQHTLTAYADHRVVIVDTHF
jgi:hypothetical protein